MHVRKSALPLVLCLMLATVHAQDVWSILKNDPGTYTLLAETSYLPPAFSTYKMTAQSSNGASVIIDMVGLLNDGAGQQATWGMYCSQGCQPVYIHANYTGPLASLTGRYSIVDGGESPMIFIVPQHV